MELLRSDLMLGLTEMIITLVLVKGTLLVGIVWGLVRLSRGTSAAVQSSRWSLMFVVLMVIPFAWQLLPWWYAGILEFPAWVFKGSAAGAAENGGAGAHPPELLAWTVPVELRSLPLASYIAIVWAVGALWFLIRFGMHRLHIERISRAGRPVDDARLLNLAGNAARLLDVQRSFRLVHTEELRTPAVFGLRRPILLLPAEACGWPDDRLTAVLCHELAHVQRNDYGALVLIELILALYWMNPLVALVARRARASQDLACDDAVLRAGVPAARYARHLVDAARALGSGPVPAAALPLARSSRLQFRVQALLDRQSEREPVARSAALRTTVLAVLGGVTFGSAELWRCHTECEPTEIAAPPPAHSSLRST